MKERYILSFWSGRKTEKKKCLITKHAKGKEKQYVRMCYDAVPKQLAKELKKFQYSTVEKGQTRRKFGGSVQWLIDSSMVNPCYNISEPYMPLMAKAK